MTEGVDRRVHSLPPPAPFSPTSCFRSLLKKHKMKIKSGQKSVFLYFYYLWSTFLKFLFLKWSFPSVVPFPFLLTRKTKSLKLFIHIFVVGGISFLPFYKFLLSHFRPSVSNLPPPVSHLPPPSPPSPTSRLLFSHLPFCCLPPHDYRACVTRGTNGATLWTNEATLGTNEVEIYQTWIYLIYHVSADVLITGRMIPIID